jgi:hypothetical protein
LKKLCTFANHAVWEFEHRKFGYFSSKVISLCVCLCVCVCVCVCVCLCVQPSPFRQSRGPAKSTWKREEPLHVKVNEAAVLSLLDKRDEARRYAYLHVHLLYWCLFHFSYCHPCSARNFDLADDLMDQLRSIGVAFANDETRVSFHVSIKIRTLSTHSCKHTR